MDLFGIDIIAVVLTAAFVSFWGAILFLFVVFYDKNPYMPRKYYVVKLEDKEGNPIRKVKGWVVTTDKVKWLRIGLKDFPSFKGVEKDIAILETMNKNGEIEIIEDVPDKYDAENYTPKNVPITQKDAFIKEICENINQEGRDMFEMKVRDALVKHSRLTDLNSSAATKEMLSQARREAERVKGDDFITKYGPTIVLICACLFAYLILDGAGKSYQAISAQQGQIMQHGYSQVIQQCGGVYHPLYEPTNSTPTQGGVAIPFITK